MKLEYYKFLIICLLLFLPRTINAQPDSELRRHVIIAFDHYIGSYESWRDNPNNLEKLLADICTPKLNCNDFISIVNYGLGTEDDSFDSYITSEVIWEPFDQFQNKLAKCNHEEWQKVIRHNNKGKCFSMLTGAKFFALASLCGKNKDKDANVVYLIDITDELYNGNNDYKTEFNNFGGRVKYDDFRNTILAVNRNYNFIHDKEITLKGGGGKPYKALLYEIVPHVPHLNSVVNYPANLGLKRVPGGFKVDFHYNTADNEYQIKRFKIESVCGNITHEIVDCRQSENNIKKVISKKITEKDTLKVVIKVWLEQKDDIFSGLVFSPYDENCKNLTVSLSLPLPPRPKILGFIPLYDEIWWFFPDDADMMVAIWTGLLIFLICLLVTYILRKYFITKSTYTPDDKAIKLRHT